MPCPICGNDAPNCDCTPEERRMHAKAEELLDRVAALEETVPRWIPVTERLPECGVDVLVYAGPQEYEGGFHVCYWEKSNRSSVVDGWFSREDLKIFWDVTHWMPLPPAPPGDEAW